MDRSLPPIRVSPAGPVTSMYARADHQFIQHLLRCRGDRWVFTACGATLQSPAGFMFKDVVGVPECFSCHRRVDSQSLWCV